MKKIILFYALIFSIIVHAKFIPATLTFTNGNVKSGFAEFVENASKEVKFRNAENADTEKIQSQELSKIEYTDKKGQKYIAKQLLLYNPNDEYVIKDPKLYANKKLWFYLIYESEKVSVVTSSSVAGYVPNGAGGLQAVQQNTYFLNFKNEDFVEFLSSSTGMVTEMGVNKQLKKRTAYVFKSRCPKLVSVIESSEFDPKKNVFAVVEYYEKNCQ